MHSALVLIQEQPKCCAIPSFLRYPLRSEPSYLYLEPTWIYNTLPPPMDKYHLQGFLGNASKPWTNLRLHTPSNYPNAAVDPESSHPASSKGQKPPSGWGGKWTSYWLDKLDKPTLINSQRSDAFDISSCDQRISDQLLCGPNNLKHHPAMGHIMSSDSLELKELLNLLVPSVSHIPEPHKVAQIWLISAVSFILHYDAIPSTVSDPILWFRFKNTFDADSPPGPGPNTYPWLGFAASSCSWKALL